MVRCDTARTRPTRCDFLFARVNISWLVFYRMAFGTIMLWHAISSLTTGYVDRFFVEPRFHFPYEGLEWIQPFVFAQSVGQRSVQPIHLEFALLGASSLLILIGLWFRAASILFMITFLHICLIDKCYYQNHYYLVCILSAILLWLPANRWCSVDTLCNPVRRSVTAPVWTLWLMRFQIAVPYIFGGIAKLNSDWLQGQPMGMALADRSQFLPFGRSWLTDPRTVQIFVWGGLLFDLFIVPVLLWKRTRVFGFACCAMFHVTNSVVWSIGLFPWLMLLATTVFLEPDWCSACFCPSFRPKVNPSGLQAESLPHPMIRWLIGAGLAVFVAWQSVFPLRQYLWNGNPSWDEYHHRFSWHMLLRGKVTGVRVYATDPITGRSGTIDLRRYVAPTQLRILGRDPLMIYQLCQIIKHDLAARGIAGIELRVLALVSLNGRRPQPMIDPYTDLANTPRQKGIPRWIMPLSEPFRHEPWTVALHEWEQRLSLDLPKMMYAPRPVGHGIH